MKCNVCGQENINGAEYCKACGAQLTSQTPPPTAPVQTVQQQTPKANEETPKINYKKITCCSACGTLMSTNALSCPRCGEPGKRYYRERFSCIYLLPLISSIALLGGMIYPENLDKTIVYVTSLCGLSSLLYFFRLLCRDGNDWPILIFNVVTLYVTYYLFRYENIVSAVNRLAE